MRIQLGAEHAIATPALSAIRDRVQCCEYHWEHSSFSQWREAMQDMYRENRCDAAERVGAGYSRVPRNFHASPSGLGLWF
jgi:hypothetical protein